MHPSRISALLAGLGLLLPAAAIAQAPGGGVVWQCAAPVPPARDHHVVFNARVGGRDMLYVGGGTDYRELRSSLQRTELGPDGMPGEWLEDTPLPKALAGASAVAARGFVVLTGGQVSTEGGLRGLTRVADTYTAPIAEDGTIGGWTPGPALPSPRFHHPSVYHDGWVYIVGGQGAAEAEADVFAARLGRDGRLGAWQRLRPLPEPRSHHAVVIDHDAVYVIGGLGGNPARQPTQHASILRAAIERDGTLGEWRKVGDMPHSYATHSAFVHEDALWVIGGVEDNQRFSEIVWRAPLGRDGTLGAWTQVAQPLPFGRGHVHVTPVIGGRVYSIGGRLGAPPQGAPPVTDAVVVGQFTPVAPVGSEATGCTAG